MVNYTPYQARYFAEQILLKRPSSSVDSIVSAMSDAKVDLNPHQVDAVLVYRCAATEWNSEHGGKPWDYAIIPHDEIRRNSDFDYLLSCRLDNEQVELQFE